MELHITYLPKIAKVKRRFYQKVFHWLDNHFFLTVSGKFAILKFSIQKEFNFDVLLQIEMQKTERVIKKKASSIFTKIERSERSFFDFEHLFASLKTTKLFC